jgi:transcription elongation factor GreA
MAERDIGTSEVAFFSSIFRGTRWNATPRVLRAAGVIEHAEAVRWDREQIGMSDRIPMSKEGYEKLKAQLDAMKHDDMPRIAEQIAQARGYGDLSENAEFDAAVEAQGMLQARINDLQDKLSRAMIVERSTMPTDRVVFGAKVRVLDLDLNEEEDFVLVGPGEEDYDQNKILLTSPIGQGLVGKKVGDEVEVPIPKGKLKLKIVEIG